MINNYVVSLFDYFDQEIKMVQVTAKDELEALQFGAISLGIEDNEIDKYESAEELIRSYGNEDMAIAALKIII